MMEGRESFNLPCESPQALGRRGESSSFPRGQKKRGHQFSQQKMQANPLGHSVLCTQASPGRADRERSHSSSADSLPLPDGYYCLAQVSTHEPFTRHKREYFS